MNACCGSPGWSGQILNPTQWNKSDWWGSEYTYKQSVWNLAQKEKKKKKLQQLQKVFEYTCMMSQGPII